MAEEGINNVHALAHADIVELMSSTRIGADRLVDWTDQAILYLRLGGNGSRPEGGHSTNWSRRTRENLAHVRQYGIRNASDLLQAYNEALRRGQQRAERLTRAGAASTGDLAAQLRQREVESFRQGLALPHSSNGNGFSAIQSMLDTLPDEEWFTQIRRWRNSEFGKASARYLYLDGLDPEPQQRESPEDVAQTEEAFECFPMIASTGDRLVIDLVWTEIPKPDAVLAVADAVREVVETTYVAVSETGTPPPTMEMAGAGTLRSITFVGTARAASDSGVFAMHLTEQILLGGGSKLASTLPGRPTLQAATVNAKLVDLPVDLPSQNGTGKTNTVASSH